MNIDLICKLNNKLSYSMMIDTKKKNNNKYLNIIQSRKLNTWISDNMVSKCFNCETKFTIFIRKHHCRICGKIFCYNCCKYYIKIPSILQTLPKENYNFINNIFYKKNDKKKSCKYCYIKILELINLEKDFKIFQLNNFLDINDYIKMKKVCKKWKKISNIYLSNFREIQYKLNDNNNNNNNNKNLNIDYKYLWNNRYNLQNHNIWIVKLLQHINWDNINKKNENNLIKIIKSKKKICFCWELMCTRQCSGKLNEYNIIEIINIKKLPNLIKKYFLNLLLNYEESKIIPFIPNLINNMIYEINDIKLIENFLINLINIKNNIILEKIYWELEIQTYNTDNIIKNYFKNFINKLKSKFIYINKLKYLLNLSKILIKLKNEKNINYIKKQLKKFISYYPSIYINNIEYKIDYNISIKNSNTKPIIIPIFDNNHNKHYLMFKYENLKNDKIIMNIIQIIKNILLTNNIELKFITYNIIPITNKCGFIKIINNSKTLYDIQKNNFTIQNYILEYNGNLTIEQIRNNYIKSCVSFCLIGYLLGIGDRHLENIMITQNGYIFHIDFSYILGDEPNFIGHPEIKITNDMVLFMGGEKSIYYNDFKNLCKKAYNCIRRYPNIFLLLLKNIHQKHNNINIEKKIIDQIIKKFLPGELHKEAEIQFIKKLDNSKINYSLLDQIHNKKKESLYYLNYLYKNIIYYIKF